MTALLLTRFQQGQPRDPRNQVLLLLGPALVSVQVADHPTAGSVVYVSPGANQGMPVWETASEVCRLLGAAGVVGLLPPGGGTGAMTDLSPMLPPFRA